MSLRGKSQDEDLDNILKKSQSAKLTTRDLSSDEITCLITSFSPAEQVSRRSKAYLVLSSFCQAIRSPIPSPLGGQDKSDPATELLSKCFGPLITSRISEPQEQDAIVGMSFLSALFQVDAQSALSIWQQDGLVDSMMDNIDLFPRSESLLLEIVRVLGQAAGHQKGRTLISTQYREWLETKSHQAQSNSLRAAAAVALVKLSRGNALDDEAVTGNKMPKRRSRDNDLTDLMKGLILNDKAESSATEVIEGLAYLSVDPNIKESLSRDATFLKKLFSLVPRRKRNSINLPDYNPTVLYGIALIMTNLCGYKPHLNEEQEQIAKLRRMATAGKTSSENTDESQNNALEDDKHVSLRGQRIIEAGGLDALSSIVHLTDTPGVRAAASKAYLSFAEEKAHRGRILQSGGAKALMFLIRESLSSSPSNPSAVTANARPLQPFELEAIQALAKLTITSSPVQVFGPDSGAAYDCVRPLSILLQHPSSNLLQRFEALMALTNIASMGPEAADRIANADGLMNQVEFLILEEHVLIRRAAVELTCNLIGGSDRIFERYGGTEDVNSAVVRSKIQILLAMSDVDDLSTRLAASGALATVSSAPGACAALRSLHSENHRVLPIFVQLIEPSDGKDEEDRDKIQDPGLKHRGLACVRNFLGSITDASLRKEVMEESESVGLVRAVAGVVKDKGVDPAVLRLAAEALKCLLEMGR